VFERFTERARKVVGLTKEEPGRLRHDFVDAEHLLLGLLREEEGVAARVLLNLDVDPDAVRREVVRRLPGGEPGPSDETGRRIEERQGDRTLFRGRVVGIRAELALPVP
jgi:ATP-dependent Clp protease ATP-binding subunit ClpC